MELLVPLIIFAIGGIISYLNDAKEKEKQSENPRNIDFDKLNEKYQKSKTEAVDEFKRLKKEFTDLKQETTTKQGKPKLDKTSKKAVEDKFKREKERLKERQRQANEAKKKVEKLQKDKSKAIAASVTDEVKHVVYDDSTYNKKLSFDKEAVVNGIVMKEILGPPKSKIRRVR
ncbi:hypothetical protein [Nosocomiicoccus massiliensis]|uniref:hypothetical protein n=1 Tax=Nosocomiicoccus massiliensis TaxID=1232430 RepID=UPI00041A35CD|nr:hypothetical protein [Nosocomiicoccus massiliensis]